MPFAGFTDLELKVIALRTNGIGTTEIARRLGCVRNTARNALTRVYSKLPFNDVALLTRWAMANGLDELLGPETSAERPYPGKAAPCQERIKLGRIRRARLKA